MSISSIIDCNGRAISLRQIGILDQLRLIKILGSELSQNTVYFGLAKISASVDMIDNVPILFPASETQIENILNQLGESGVEAVGSTLYKKSEELVNIAGN